MLYTCSKCNYSTDRLLNYKRHVNRKTPCVTTDGVESNTSSDNVDNNNDNVNESRTCSKCKKVFARKYNRDVHEKSCNGIQSKQCPVCLRFFTTKQGKYKHVHYVKCKPPPPPSGGPTTINNNIHYGNVNNGPVHNYNIGKIEIRNNFDTLTREDIVNIVKEIHMEHYCKMIESNLESGKYIVPRTMDSIFFNDNFPNMQILKKERRNDNMLDVHIGQGQWEKRFVNDISPVVVSRVEDFHSTYINHQNEKYKHIDRDTQKWKRISRPIKTYANAMTWYDGFKGTDVERIGVTINEPEDDNESNKRNKELIRLIAEKIYEKTSKS